MALMRSTTAEEKEALQYLNDLRDSGATNMMGASPYVQSEFGLEASAARKLVALWMENFEEMGDYDEVKI